MKRRPERTVHDPRPLAVRALLSRQDVAAPPEFLTEDVEHEQGYDLVHEHPPCAGERDAEKSRAAAEGPLHEGAEFRRRRVHDDSPQAREQGTEREAINLAEHADRDSPHPDAR